MPPIARLTSESHPLRIDFVPPEAAPLPGRIGVTFAPGKHDDAAASGPWRRDLDADLARMRDVYRVDVLVSLVEDPELTLLAIPSLFTRAERAGIRVVRFPIPDVSVPASIEDAVALVRGIVDDAAAGRNVVIHCRGGLGRSGTIAAACLVVLGRAPDDAIAITRAARRGAIETDEQARFVAAVAAAVGPNVVRGVEPSVPFTRVRGCVLGGAIGDALGYPFEFVGSASQILAAHGGRPPKRLPRRPGDPGALVSDDTQMTLFTIEGLVRARHGALDGEGASPVRALQHAYFRWYATQVPSALGPAIARDHGARGWLLGEPALHARRAPGNTCLSALAATLRDGDTPDVRRPPNDSKGCGAVMRAAPIGLAAKTRDEAFALARDAAVLTHGHPSGYLSAAYLASVVFDVARGASLDAAMREADASLAPEAGSGELREVIARVRAEVTRGAPGPDAIARIGEGWVGEEALGVALSCALTVGDPTPTRVGEALWRAVAHAGDSDSTGSITGQLLGAMHGDAALPLAWREDVELRAVLDRAARDLFAAFQLGASLDRESYPTA